MNDSAMQLMVRAHREQLLSATKSSLRWNMQTEERNRIVKAYYKPELNPIARVAKCTAGLAIIVLIAVIGVTSTDDGREKLADDGHALTSIMPKPLAFH